jgi:hypothetical protein
LRLSTGDYEKFYLLGCNVMQSIEHQELYLQPGLHFDPEQGAGAQTGRRHNPEDTTLTTIVGAASLQEKIFQHLPSCSLMRGETNAGHQE